VCDGEEETEETAVVVTDETEVRAVLEFELTEGAREEKSEFKPCRFNVPPSIMS
jgi:hypothetical protein